MGFMLNSKFPWGIDSTMGLEVFKTMLAMVTKTLGRVMGDMDDSTVASIMDKTNRAEGTRSESLQL